MTTVTNQDLATKLDTLTEVMNLRLGRVEKSLDKVNEAIYGNGEPGLKERVNAVEQATTIMVTEGSRPLKDISQRVALLENTHAVCPIVDVERAVIEMKARDDAAAKAKPNGDKSSAYITWQWVLEKTLLPIVITFMAWFLFTVLPQLLQHIP